MSFFTDAGTKEAANLDQWQNGPINNLDPTQDQWVNGNLNGSQAHYSEGEYVPYRTTLSALDSDTKYWHEFQWDTTVGAGKHALDNLGSYDATFVPLPAGEVYPEPILGGPGVGDNKTVGSATVTAFDIPDDSRVLAGKDGVIGTSDDIDQGDGVMTLFGGTFDGYALRGADGNFGPIIYGNSATWTTDDLLLRPGGDALFNTADDELVAPGTDGRLGTGDDVVTTSGTSVSIINGADGVLGNTDDNNPYTYTGTYAGASTASLVPVITYNGSAEGNAILAWGGHIATRADWGDGNSAAAISGSSYHMRGLDFISQNDSTVSSGNQDRSLQNTAVTFPASITIEKQTDIDGSLQVFDFELTRPTNTIDVINGYVDLSGDRFIDGQDDGKFVDSLGEIFTIVDGEVTAYNSTGTVNSYFVNSSGLVVSGSTSGPVVTALNIAGTGTDTFSLTDNGSITFDNLVDFSSYTIKEIVPSNWDLTSINRVETDDINTGDVNDTIDPLASNSTNISLTETDQWSLTFNNKLIFVPNAAISILKYTNGSDGPSLNEGETVTWTYFVSNDGNVPLSDVVVSDDNGTPLVAGDNFFPTYVSGDAGNIGFLDPGEIWSYQYEGIADVGLYENIGKVTGDYAGKTEIATDVSSYVGIDVLPTLEVLKTASTNSVPETGADVDFTFTVKNTSAESVTITSLIDSDYGDLTLLSAAAAALIGTTLAPGASTASFTITQWVEGDFGGDDHINTFTAKAKDDEGNEASDTEDETITFSDVKPDISVIKLVDANGDGIFSDEEWTVAGNDRDVEYQFTITNNNAESVTLDSITDSKLVGADLLTAAIAAHGSAILAGNGDSVTFTYNTELDLVDGIDDPYINTVSAVASDNDGNSDTATDSAKINVLSPGYVTNSSLCDFGDVFDLIFTPDLKNWSASPQGVYKLSDSNPGQFYYNTFFTPEDVGDKDGVFEAGETLTLSIPYPFVTQGANPVHAYSSVTEHEPGCFVPGTEIFNGGSSMAFTLNQYTDTNGDGKIGYGDNYTMTVNLDQLPDGFVYLNAHFDYGLEKENGWKRSGENALNDPVINPGLSGVNIMEPTSHVFSSSIIGSTDSIANNNEFKNPKGFGGLVEIKVSDVNNDGDYLDSVDVTEAVVGAKVELWNGTGTTKLDTAYTDINGWYFMPNFIHKGSIATYQVKLVADTNATDNVTYAGETKSTIVGKGDKFGEGYFQVVDTTGGPGYTALVLDGDPLLNSHAPTLFDENSAALQQVVDNAIVYWAEHGANADQLALLSGTTIKISDLGNISDGKTLAMWDGSGITFDDDAAGYGWSIGLGNVNPNRVDGLSALVHEYGHVLGYEHDVLGENLAVGERDLPEIELIGATHTLEMFV